MYKISGSRLRKAFSISEVPAGAPSRLFGKGREYHFDVAGVPAGHALIGEKGNVMQTFLEEPFRGRGLGKKMYGELMRRQPEQTLTSDVVVSDKARRVWEALKKSPSYSVEEPPLKTVEEGILGKARALLDPSGSLIPKNVRPPYRGSLPSEAKVAAAVGVEMKNGKKRILSEPEAAQMVQGKTKELNEFLRNLGTYLSMEPKVAAFADELSKIAESGKPQWLEIPYTEGERSMQNVPVRGKRKPGDAPVADGSENYYASRMNPTWQPQESAVSSKTAGLHPLVKSTTDTHPDRGSDGVPIRLYRNRETGERVTRTSPDPQPITEVQSGSVGSRV